MIHGGDLDAARRRFPGAPEPWIDLSTGINPVPFALPAFGDEAWSRLPLESEDAALRLAAARYYGASDPETIVAAPGTQALIQILPRLVARTRVAILGPTYSEHQLSWTRTGHDVIAVATLEAAIAKRAGVIVAVNPDNPTGRLLSRESLVAAAQAVATSTGLLVVDEAFMDVIEASESLVPVLPRSTVVLRSFGKMFGLAGLRLGFAVANPVLASTIRAELGPWAVAGPALIAGQQALYDRHWQTAARLRLRQDSSRLDQLLTAAGCTLLGGTPLFRLLAHPRAASLSHHLGENGIHVRRFEAQQGWLRFGIPGSDVAWSRLAGALRSNTHNT